MKTFQNIVTDTLDAKAHKYRDEAKLKAVQAERVEKEAANLRALEAAFLKQAKTLEAASEAEKRRLREVALCGEVISNVL